MKIFIVLISILITINLYSAENNEYLLQQGDKIKVTVYGHEDLSGDFEVDSAGDIILPLIHRVSAQGKSRIELIDIIVDKLKPNYLKNPKVSIEVINYRPFYILGEVRKPGGYPYVNGMTLDRAVAIAGGYTYRAKIKSVTIVRATDKTNAKSRAHNTTKILPGDTIEVPERFF